VPAVLLSFCSRSCLLVRACACADVRARACCGAVSSRALKCGLGKCARGEETKVVGRMLPASMCAVGKVVMLLWQ